MNNFYLRFNRDIWSHPELTTEQKLILNFAWNFEVKAGYCYASNSYMSEIFGLPEYRILSAINELVDLNLICVKYQDDVRFLVVNKAFYSIEE